MILFQGEIAEIESGHASVRRDLNVLSCQGHAMKLQTMSCRQVLRNRRGRLDNARALGLFAKRLATQRKRTAGDADVGAGDAHGAKVRRTGGGYRSFLSGSARGDPRGCCRPGLGAEHRVQTDEGMSESKRDGAHRLDLSHLDAERPYEQTKT